MGPIVAALLSVICVAVSGFAVDNPQELQAIMSAMSNHQDAGLEEEMGLTPSLTEQLDSYLDSSTLSRVARGAGHFKLCCGTLNETVLKMAKEHMEACKQEMKKSSKEGGKEDKICGGMQCLVKQSGLADEKGEVSDEKLAESMSQCYKEKEVRDLVNELAKDCFKKSEGSSDCMGKRMFLCTKSVMGELKKKCPEQYRVKTEECAA
ncbi:uncharacterized protein [Periplaneta americana]|uniref:uncharacterized protein n=1 Tax=Periplaneta americana TaxID=6978 RepID=UPI0037E9506E